MMSHHQLPPDTEADQSYLFVTICPDLALMMVLRFWLEDSKASMAARLIYNSPHRQQGYDHSPKVSQTQ